MEGTSWQDCMWTASLNNHITEVNLWRERGMKNENKTICLQQQEPAAFIYTVPLLCPGIYILRCSNCSSQQFLRCRIAYSHAELVPGIYSC